jgi:polysaccharide deacetylase family protein (PEP-CTERM system associated)
MLNCFSVDVESFAESNVEGLAIRPQYLDQAEQDYEVEKNTDEVLGLLAEQKVKATFFILGRIARDLPHVVRRVAEEGHEIGCHSLEHKRIYGQRPEIFREQLRQAKGFLEDASGEPVYGFRSPDFSIIQSSAWALDTLRETGFVYDSSIFPFGGHDVYGIKDAQPSIHKLPNGLIEWPLATVEVLKRRLPFGGGGYFRLYPAALTQSLISRVNKQGWPCMFYIHPWEVGELIPRIPELSMYRRFRHYHRCGRIHDRLRHLCRQFRFAQAAAVLREMGYTELKEKAAAVSSSN